MKSEERVEALDVVALSSVCRSTHAVGEAKGSELGAKDRPPRAD
jgi:hypothetical protein